MISLIFLCCSGNERQDKQEKSRKELLESLQTIQSAIKVGVNQTEYRNLLIKSQSTLDSHNRKFPKDETIIPLEYALGIYKDAATVWQLNKVINFGSTNEFEKKMVKKYKLYEYASPPPDMNSNTLQTPINSIYSDKAVKIIWQYADLILSAENLLKNHK